MEQNGSSSSDGANGVSMPTEISQNASREGWYGTILLAGSVLVIISIAGLAAWWGYEHVYKAARESKSSITELPKGESETTMSEKDSSSKSNESLLRAPLLDTEETQAAPKFKEESIAVLNGGGPAGSAAKGADLLKKASFTHVSVGNTKKDYAGVTVYFASGKDDAALEVKKALLRQYPKATSQEAPKTDPETSVSAIVVIIGK